MSLEARTIALNLNMVSVVLFLETIGTKCSAILQNKGFSCPKFQQTLSRNTSRPFFPNLFFRCQNFEGVTNGFCHSFLKKNENYFSTSVALYKMDGRPQRHRTVAK